MNKIEQKFNSREEEPLHKIIKGSEAPLENRSNPFYNPYHWGMADWEGKELYLPESDEAISFSIAAHELGHLVDNGRIQPKINNFEDTYQEELRAWDNGWQYLANHISDYYQDEPEMIEKVSEIKNEIQKILLETTLLTKSFYKEENLGKDKNKIRQDFLKGVEGKKIKEILDNLENIVNQKIKEINEPRLARKIDWSKFEKIIRLALKDIEMDNKNPKH
jgi:hypothetical protein